MIKLYYTNTTTYLGVQGKKEKSLGGYPSSTPIPNSQIGSLFSRIAPYTLQNEIKSIIGLIIKNEGDNTINDITFYFDLPEDAIGSFQIAAVSLSQDSEDRYYMEEIANSQSLPYYATFNDADGEENAVGLGSLASGGMLGLWIKREVLNSVKSCDDLFDDFENSVEAEINENIGLVFNWDELGDSSSSESSSS